MARKKVQWYRLKHVRVPVPLFLAVLMVVVFVGWRLLSIQQDGLAALHATVVQASEMYAAEQKAVSELAQKVNLASSDEFIANEARTKYGYLAPGEIRYVVTNPEVLWGEGGVPMPTENPAPGLP